MDWFLYDMDLRHESVNFHFDLLCNYKTTLSPEIDCNYNPLCRLKPGFRELFKQKTKVQSFKNVHFRNK